MYVKFVGRVTIKAKNYFGRLCSCNSIIVSLASITFFCSPTDASTDITSSVIDTFQLLIHLYLKNKFNDTNLAVFNNTNAEE